MKPLSRLSVKSPLGSLFLICDEQTVVAAGFSSFAALYKKLSAHDQSRELVEGKNFRWLENIVADYFDGNLDAFNVLQVRQPGNEFSQKAWRAMRKIPSGKVITYQSLARKAGSSAAVRAAGTACGRNAIAPIIPCHRIIRSDGSLGNYGYGVGKKSWLLRHEGAID